jgi:hypothetical protein
MRWAMLTGSERVLANCRSIPLLSHLEMFEKWRDPMFIDTAHHHCRLRLEIDAFVEAASSRDFGRFMSALRR